MIRCKHNCFPDGKNICCTQCPQRDTCNDVCQEVPTECTYAVYEDEETTALDNFQMKAMVLMQSIVNLDRQKKALEAQDSDMRSQLEQAMDQYGVKNFENDLLKITYVEPYTKESFDSKRFKADCPEVAAKYTKVSQVKGSVRIQVK